MKTFLVSVALAVILLAFAGAMAKNARSKQAPAPGGPLPELVHVEQLKGLAALPVKAPTDSLYLMGGPGELSGTFQDAVGLPDRQGWTGIDLYQRTESNWQVSTYNAADLDPGTSGNHAWWCGDYLDPCSPEDPAEGYGNYWYEFLDWFGTVPDPGSDVTVRVQAVISYDIEPGEDFLFLKVNNSEWMETLETFTFSATALAVNSTVTLTPDYFVGDLGDQVHLQWEFSSDGAWSDEDCLWPTMGAAQIDLIQVFFDQGGGEVQMGTTETCEPGDPLQWLPTPVRGPGDFSKVWMVLDDADPAAQNDSPQFAFIDDGVVVPGTGGYPCTSYCYGPGGFIVNPDRGMADLYEYLNNEIWSPVLEVPPGDWDEALFSFDQYVHAELDNGGAYVLGRWHVRSTADPTGLTGWSSWLDRNVALWGSPRYVREVHNVTDLLVPGFTHVQLAFGAVNYYGGLSYDGTPAPYFDNVSFKLYESLEPAALLVEPDGSGDYPTIQSAIYAAAVGDTVLLADGVFTGAGNRDLIFFGKEIVVCSRSGNPENCVIDVEGAPGAFHRGFLFSSQEGPGSVVSGLTITGGYMDQSSTALKYSGGGIACRPGSGPTISNCIFLDNMAIGSGQLGGGVFCNEADPVISDCIFEGNGAFLGGAVGAMENSSPVISNCLIVGNDAIFQGAAVYGEDPSVHVTLSSCTVYGNTNPANTGTLIAMDNARFDIDHTIVAFNGTGYAAASSDSASLFFSCSNIYGNTREDWSHFIIDQLGVDGNISLDPLFCLDDGPISPFTLHEDSPCGPDANPACGLIGTYPVDCGKVTAVDDLPEGAPRARLFPCYPNPFNPRTTLSFHLPVSGPVEVRVYGLDGRLVTTLVNEVMATGRHEIHWDGTDERGRAVASGVFFCRLRAGTDEDTVRMVLIR